MPANVSSMLGSLNDAVTFKPVYERLTEKSIEKADATSEQFSTE